MSLLSKPAIQEQLGRGIVIDPYKPSHLKTCSYDVCLGPYFYRWRAIVGSTPYFNPFDPKMVERHFGEFEEAPIAGEVPLFCEVSFSNVKPEDRVIVMEPGEMILGHTLEFVGGTKDPKSGRCFTAEMKARSSVGRCGFEVCRCAGWGDVGYVNRWTMEIVNTTKVLTTLVVGMRLAQMKFYEVDPVDDEDLYGYDSNRDSYQGGTDIEAIRAAWRPEMLLPRLTTT